MEGFNYYQSERLLLLLSLTG